MGEAPGRRAVLRPGRPARSFKVLSYPSGMTVSTRALGMLAHALRRRRRERATRWRKLSAGRKALLVARPPAQGRDLRRAGLRLPDRNLDGLPLPARGDRAARRAR